MKSIFISKRIDYNGSQLRSGWIVENAGPSGDAIVSFIGGCDVRPEFMVDLEDLKAGLSIYSEEMLHFIIEHPSMKLSEAVARQRLFVCIIKETLEGLVQDLKLRRSGNDLFEGDKKLSISVATKSPSSGLIHTGVNISSRNTPVKTTCLRDHDIAPKYFAELILKRYTEEVESIDRCIKKVKMVK